MATAIATREVIERAAPLTPSGEPAAAAATPESAAAPSPVEPRADDGEAPDWPDEAVESAMRVEQQERDGGAPPTQRPEAVKAAAPAEEDESKEPLPKLDALIERIPSEVRETLEELFRARFTGVQRVPKQALKG